MHRVKHQFLPILIWVPAYEPACSQCDQSFDSSTRQESPAWGALCLTVESLGEEAGSGEEDLRF